MTLKEMKENVLELIEEISPDSPYLTDDPDIQAKINGVINDVMFEAARMKKIPDYVEFEVTENQLVRFADIETYSGSKVYQLDKVRGVSYDFKASGTVIKVNEAGVIEIEYFKYPKEIKKDTKDDTYIFELSDDVLRIMPYGIAADLLKSDVSANYGSVYSQRYETMLQRLDSRYSASSIEIEGGEEYECQWEI